MLSFRAPLALALLALSLHAAAPPQFKDTPIQLTATANTTSLLALRPLLLDPSQPNLRWGLSPDAPSWLTLDAPNDQLKASPPLGAAGLWTFKLTVTDSGEQGDVNHPAELHVVSPPSWKQDPLNLGTQKIGVPFAYDLTQWVNNPSGGDLSFSVISGKPGWMTLAASGTLTGTPAASDLGPYQSFVIRVTSVTTGLFADVSAYGAVVQPSPPPSWTETPIPLPDAPVGQAYTQRIDTFAKPGTPGDRLSFSKVGGPDWVALTAQGLVIGTPAARDEGLTSMQVRVTDQNGGSADDTVTIHVPPIILHPPKWLIDPIPLGQANIGQAFVFTLGTFATSVDGLPLHFKKVSGPNWLYVADDGTITGTPAITDIGAFTAIFEVDDAHGSAQAGAFGTVVQPPGKPPVIQAGTLVFTVQEGATLQVNLNDPKYVSDPQGRPLSFLVENAPGWVALTGGGLLTLKPTHAEIGDHTYTVKVSNDIPLSTEGTLLVHVLAAPPVVDTMQVDKAVANAPADNVWVFDYHLRTLRFTRHLFDNVHRYFDALARAQVNATAVLLSAACEKFHADPVPSSAGNPLLLSTQPDAESDFRKRVDSEYVSILSCTCNSPLWTLFQFFLKLPGLPFYQKGYFLPQVPMDVMIATPRSDDYAHFTKETPEAGWGPADFAKNFQAFHQKAQKPFRVSAITTKCRDDGSVEDEGPDGTGDEATDCRAEGAYRIVSDATGGTLYPWTGSQSMAAALEDYAQKIIFRAYVAAKTSIPLSKKPVDPGAIQVTVGSVTLSADKWSYDTASNSVRIRWDQIDLSTLHPGDLIQITYRGS